VTARYTICGTALYWSIVQGFWGSQDEAESAFNRMVRNSREYATQVEKKYGKEFPSMGEKARTAIDGFSVGTWNSGIQKTFNAVTEASSTAAKYAQETYDSMTKKIEQLTKKRQ